MIKSKAQSAMEFLMTYGWTVIVVLVSISALSYFGVLSPDIFVPEKCSLPAGITCLDFEVGSTLVTLVLQNNFGWTITIDEIAVAGENGGSCSYSESVMLKNGEKAIFIVPNCNNGNIRDKFDGKINVTYTKESLLIHKMGGTIYGKVTTETTSTSSNTICQNAEDHSLCGGLDLLFGEGYKDSCCSEYPPLCC